MPELPDLAIFAESLQRLVLNKEIIKVVYHRDQRLNVEPALLYDALTSQRITNVSRAGKELLFELSNNASFMIHLMLSGGFKYGLHNQKVSFPILTVDFSDGNTLVVYDPKGWVTVTLNPDLDHRPVDALNVDTQYLEKMFGKKPKANLKAFLLDQRIITGIGNAYADEILWDARLSPKSIVGKIPAHVIPKLASSIKSVLGAAISHIRTNHPGIISGEIRDFLSVHNSTLKSSPSGSPIIVEDIASKKTYYTEEQVLYS